MTIETRPARIEEILHKLHTRHRQLNDFLQTEETSREGAHDWKAEIVRGRLQEIDWAIELVEKLEA
jgi:hypothetical protein